MLILLMYSWRLRALLMLPFCCFWWRAVLWKENSDWYRNLFNADVCDACLLALYVLTVWNCESYLARPRLSACRFAVELDVYWSGTCFLTNWTAFVFVRVALPFAVLNSNQCGCVCRLYLTCCRWHACGQSPRWRHAIVLWLFLRCFVVRKEQVRGGSVKLRPSHKDKYLWIRVALLEKCLAKIVEHLVDNGPKYYERDSIVADACDGPLLASLLSELVGQTGYFCGIWNELSAEVKSLCAFVYVFWF